MAVETGRLPISKNDGPDRRYTQIAMKSVEVESNRSIPGQSWPNSAGIAPKFVVTYIVQTVVFVITSWPNPGRSMATPTTSGQHRSKSARSPSNLGESG